MLYFLAGYIANNLQIEVVSDPNKSLVKTKKSQ